MKDLVRLRLSIWTRLCVTHKHPHTHTHPPTHARTHARTHAHTHTHTHRHRVVFMCTSSLRALTEVRLNASQQSEDGELSMFVREVKYKVLWQTRYIRTYFYLYVRVYKSARVCACVYWNKYGARSLMLFLLAYNISTFLHIQKNIFRTFPEIITASDNNA